MGRWGFAEGEATDTARAEGAAFGVVVAVPWPMATALYAASAASWLLRTEAWEGLPTARPDDGKGRGVVPVAVPPF